MSDEKRENYASEEHSDVEGVDSGAEEDSSVPAATIPKKRGRPAKGDKVEKVPSGRGRGRPAKVAAAAAEGSDSDVAVENGKKATGTRGRPGKNAQKLNIVASGKGRGRPKAANKRAAEEGNSSPKKVQAAGGKRGRPRKAAQASDDEEVVEEEEEEEEEVEEVEDEEVEHEKKKIGRPPTGAVYLNIKRTGKGQGRPSQAQLERRAAAEATGSPTKRRGRPPVKSKEVTTEENIVEENDEDEFHDSVTEIEDPEEEKSPKIVAEGKRAKLAAA